MLTWNICSSIPPSSAPTSILPAPKKAGSQEIGRSRGGLTTKLHVAVDAQGNPLRVILSAGQIADIDHASALIENLSGQAVVADKGYDADHFVAERFNRTLKEQAIHGRVFRNLEEVRQAVTQFRDRYNRHWRLEKLGFMSPLEARQPYAIRKAA
jgi:transposase